MLATLWLDRGYVPVCMWACMELAVTGLSSSERTEPTLVVQQNDALYAQRRSVILGRVAPRRMIAGEHGCCYPTTIQEYTNAPHMHTRLGSKGKGTDKGGTSEGHTHTSCSLTPVSSEGQAAVTARSSRGEPPHTAGRTSCRTSTHTH